MGNGLGGKSNVEQDGLQPSKPNQGEETDICFQRWKALGQLSCFTGRDDCLTCGVSNLCPGGNRHKTGQD